MILSDQLRTIGARLVLHADSQIDGQMVLEIASQVAALESTEADLREATEAFSLAANDMLNAMKDLTAKLASHQPNPQLGDAQRST